jgi:hypothetical protein
MRKALFSLMVLCLQYITKAQQKFPSLDFIPQSPTTAAFTRYGDIRPEREYSNDVADGGKGYR